MSRKRKLLVAVAAVFALLAMRQIAFPGRSFDSDGWRNTPYSYSVRREMADRFVTCGTLDGKTREEVAEMLGEPGRVGQHYRPWEMAYWVGEDGGMFANESGWLVIRLGNDDRVIGCRFGWY